MTTPVQYGSLREKIAAEKVARATDYARFEVLVAQANEAGRAAAAACVPAPMVVCDSTGFTYEPIADGVCGFAWVVVSPATSRFARWLSKYHTGWRTAYSGGLQLWVSDYNQSMAKKEAYASAYARVLRDAGIKAYSDSRMD